VLWALAAPPAAGSPFDRWFHRGDTDALNASARRGYLLFRGRAQCGACHAIGKHYALFTDNAFHDLGVGLGRLARSVEQLAGQARAAASTPSFP
jgi:cytochrome c peroxidase